MDKKLLLEIKKYIEETHERIDGEWGQAHFLDQLIKEKDMPDIYWKILELIEKEDKNAPQN